MIYSAWSKYGVIGHVSYFNPYSCTQISKQATAKFLMKQDRTNVGTNIQFCLASSQALGLANTRPEGTRSVASQRCLTILEFLGTFKVLVAYFFNPFPYHEKL